MGAVIAPLTLLGGPLMIRAAWYTAGIVGGLSTVAMCAPSEKFLNMGGPLAVGFGVVFASSLGESEATSPHKPCILCTDIFHPSIFYKGVMPNNRTSP